MDEIVSNLPLLLLAMLEGSLLGMFFFLGLWWTVRKIESTRHVALLFLVSMVLRTGIVILGFYFMLGNSWQGLAAGLLGFIIARIIIIRLTRIGDHAKNNMGAGSS